MNRIATITLAMLVLATGAGASEADQPPVPPVSKAATPAASGREPENKALKASPATEAPAGVMVFIDPATGKIVQPTEAEIGSLARPPQEGPKAKAPLVTIEGPGGAVGIVLTPESFSYSIATRTPDGKIALDCVTGGQAAQRIVAGQPNNSKAAPQAKGSPDETKK